MMLKNDKFTLAFIFGAISTILFEAVTRILIFYGFGKFSLYELNSLAITANRPNVVIGIIIAGMVAGFGGTILYCIIRKYGKKFKLNLFGALGKNTHNHKKKFQ